MLGGACTALKYVNKHASTGRAKENGSADIKAIPRYFHNKAEPHRMRHRLRVVGLYHDVCAEVWQEMLTACVSPSELVLQQRTFACCFDGLSAYRRSPLNLKSALSGSVKIRVDCTGT